jgi:DNA polymerase III epsilon subunit-like protein
MDSVLRDLERERSKMQSDVENLNRHYGKLVGFVRQYLTQTTVEWAKLVVSHPKTLLLVVETSRIVDESGYSYGVESEPIRFTGLALASGEIWDQLLHPTHSRQVLGAEYHGLTMVDVEAQPRLADVWSSIAERLEDRPVILFGADWTRQALRSVDPTYAHALDSAFCLHNKCKEYYGEFYELSLEKVLGYQGIDKKRDELKDSRDRLLMLVQVMNNLAVGMEKQTQDPETSEDNSLEDLDDHPF